MFTRYFVLAVSSTGDLFKSKVNLQYRVIYLINMLNVYYYHQCIHKCNMPCNIAKYNISKADSLVANTSVITVSFIYPCLEDSIMVRQQ